MTELFEEVLVNLQGFKDSAAIGNEFERDHPELR
jgi:hypothetical protein